MSYDGTGKLSEALAELFRLSAKNHNKIADLIKEAKQALAITAKAKRLPVATKQVIYQWHYQRVNLTGNETVELISQVNQNEVVELSSQPEAIEPVETISHTEPSELVEYISQPTHGETVETISQASLSQSVELFSQTRIAFYTQKAGQRSRQVIALEGYYMNALATLGVNKTDVPKWVQTAVNRWEAFNPELPITKQVKCLIVQALMDAIQS